MIDPRSEDLLSLREACAALPGRPHISTIHRWRLRGVRGVRLETILVGGRRFTSRTAIADFIARASGTEKAGGTLADSVLGSTRQKQIAAAERRFHDATN